MLIQFHYHKCLKYLFLSGLFFSLRQLIRDNTSNYNDDPIIKIFTTYCGEILSGFIYIYYKNLVKNLRTNRENLRRTTFKETKKNNNQIKGFKKHLVTLTIFWCTVLDFFGIYNYNIHFSSGMKKLNIIYKNTNTIFLRFFISISENYFLNIQTYVHHLIGLTLIIFSAFLIILMNISLILENEISFLFVLIISLESQATESFLYSFEKKLNYEYFVSIYYICFLEGLIGIIIITFYLIIYSFFVKSYSFLEAIKSFHICYIILDIILTLFFNIFRLKIIEVTKPSYNIIANFLGFLFLTIFYVIQKNENKKITKEIIISTIFCSLGTMIFCEIMTLHFWDLDKNTNNETKNRARLDSIRTSQLFDENIIKQEIN